MEYIVKSIYLEITRRCNLNCAHCMRGRAQNIDMSKEDVDKLFDELKGAIIEDVTFGGGEPTLNPEMIEYVIDKIIREEISVLNIQMITNGQVFDQRVADAFNRFIEYEYSKSSGALPDLKRSDCKHAYIGFSTDRFHKPISDKNIKLYKENCPYVTFMNHCVPDDEIYKTGNSTFGIELIRRLIPIKYYASPFDVKILNVLCLSARGELGINPDGNYLDFDFNNYGHIQNINFYDLLVQNGLPWKTSRRIEETAAIERRLKARGAR